MRILSFLCGFLPALTLSARVLVSVPSSIHLPNPATLPSTTSATLTTLSSSLHAPLSASNEFDFRNVSAGSYLLDVHCASHVFAPLRVDVGADGDVQAWQHFRGHDWDNKGETMGAGAIEVKVLGAKGYYLERSGCEYFSAA